MKKKSWEMGCLFGRSVGKDKAAQGQEKKKIKVVIPCSNTIPTVEVQLSMDSGEAYLQTFVCS